MNIIKKALVGLLFLTAIACSKTDENKTTLVKGLITVADSIDSSGDYSGIGFTILYRDSVDAAADTIFHAVTDTTGSFEGEAVFKEKGRFPFIVSRNNRNLGAGQVILAEDDTLKVQGELPDLASSIRFNSDEYQALESFERVNRSFNRVALFINAGRISPDSAKMELKKFSDLFWSVYEQNPSTIAASLAARESVRLLKEWDEEAMMDRINSALPEENMIQVGLSFGKEHVADHHGLERASSYIDSLKGLTKNKELKMQADMQRITLYYDSLKTDQAKKYLGEFEKRYSKNEDAMAWADNMRYDLTYLGPGVTAPEFGFKTETGDTVLTHNPGGKPYLLEVTTLASRAYQEHYERIRALYYIYNSYNLNVYTLPLDQSEVTVDAFYEERGKLWPVVNRGSFDEQELIEKFNITRIPTWLLVDGKGVIIKKYTTRDIDTIIMGLNKVVNKTNTES